MPARRGAAVLVAGPDGAPWLFEAGGFPVAIEESIFFAQAEGPRRTEQIVVYGRAPDVTEVRWSLSRRDGDDPLPGADKGTATLSRYSQRWCRRTRFLAR